MIKLPDIGAIDEPSLFVLVEHMAQYNNSIIIKNVHKHSKKINIFLKCKLIITDKNKHIADKQ